VSYTVYVIVDDRTTVEECVRKGHTHASYGDASFWLARYVGARNPEIREVDVTLEVRS
jgi:hypothetical protein